MKKSLFLSLLATLWWGGTLQAQAPMPIPNGSFEQWTSHPGYSVTVLFVPISVYNAYSTPSVWGYPSYPVNQTVSYMGMNVNVNTSVPLVKASEETGGAPDGNKAVKLQTFMLEDIVNPTVLNLASGSIDPSLTQQIVPSILLTGTIDINAFLPLLSSLMSGSGDIYSMIPTLVTENVNDYITGGLVLGNLRPGRLTGSYKYHSAVSGDNGGILMLGTRYNTVTHRRDIVGGGFDTSLTDASAYTPFEVAYQPLSALIPGSPNLDPDSLIVLLFSSAGNNRQQGSYLCLDNLALWPAPDTVWRSVTVASANGDWGSVSGGGTYPDSTLVTLSALPSSGYHFTAWHDGNGDNPRQVLVISDTAFTALFAPDTTPTPPTPPPTPPTPPAPDTVWHTVTVTASADGVCEPYGSGLYADGDTAEIGYLLADTATLGGHWEYLGWNDGETGNPRQVVITSDTAFVILCQWIADSVGIEPTGSVHPTVHLYPNPAHGRCTATLGDNRPAHLKLYSIDGRLLQTLTSDGTPAELNLPWPGVFLLSATTSTGSTTLKIINR